MSKKNKGKGKKSGKKSSAALCACANCVNATTPGLFGNIGNWLRERPSEQFLLGAALGAAATYILSNDELRGRLLKGGIELYTNIAGGLAELREQAADIRAEVEAGKTQANSDPA